MKKIITSVALLLAAISLNAQTTATDFTAMDCKGNNHTLFTELNNGKTIVLVWVMPCTMCVSGGDAAYNAVHSFEISQPGKVLYYLIDDLGDNNCASLGTWAKTNGIDTSKITIFDNTGNAIKESNFGGSGMPHIVVVSGIDHKIIYNEKNGSGTGVQNALNIATSVSDVTNSIKFFISPNPVAETLAITYSKSVASISILSLTGQTIKEEIFGTGKLNPTLSLSGVATGSYLVRITDVDGKTGVQKVIKE